MAKKNDIQQQPNMEEKILAAAEELFFSQGYSETSTTQIAKTAGCNQALVHYYFRTKDKLFNEILKGKVMEVFRGFLVLEAGEGTFEEKLTRLIEMHYDTVREHQGMVLFLITELTRNPGLFHDLVNDIGDLPMRTLQIFSGDLEREIEAGRIREISLIDLIVNIVSLNVFLFAARPIFGKVWHLDEKGMEEFLDHRKKEIVNTVLLSLRP